MATKHHIIPFRNAGPERKLQDVERSYDRPHDVGGHEGLGPLQREADEPPFHHEWEARVFALNRLLLMQGVYNLDEFRYAVERMDPEEYRSKGYYERWFLAIERLLAEKKVLP
jgi:nitrile hydratase